MSANAVEATEVDSTLSRMAVMALGLVVFAFYTRLIIDNSVIYWYDAHIRLGLADQLVVGRWLPVLQAVIVTMHRLTGSVHAIRIVLAALSIASLLALYRLVGHLLRADAGLVAVILLAANVMFSSLAIVTQPEVLFVGFIALALFFLDRPWSRPTLRFAMGVVCMNLACATRYEGLLLAGVLIVESLIEPLQARQWRTVLLRAVTGAALFGFSTAAWAAVGYMAIETPETLFADRLNREHWRLFFTQFWDLLTWQAGSVTIGLGGLGWWCALRDERGRRTAFRIGAFLMLDVLMIGLLQPWQGGNLRQTFVSVVFIYCFAALGLVYLVSAGMKILSTAIWRSISPAARSRWRACVAAGAAVFMALPSVQFTSHFISETSREPRYYYAALAGDWLRDQETTDAVILALTDNAVQPYALAGYSNLHLDRILSDDRFEAATIESQISDAGWVYVLAVQADDAGLSSSEQALLGDLESGRIPAEYIEVGPADVWFVSTSVLAQR